MYSQYLNQNNMFRPYMAIIRFCQLDFSI